MVRVVVPVLRDEVAGVDAVTLAGIVVAVVVDHDRPGVGAHHPVAERLGEQLRLEHVVGRSVGHHAPGEQQHAIRVPGLAEVVRRQHHGRAGRGLVGDQVEDALLGSRGRAR